MGNPEDFNPTPPASPHRSTTSIDQDPKLHRKGWFALGASLGLVVILLVALIIVASTRPTQIVQDCPDNEFNKQEKNKAAAGEKFKPPFFAHQIFKIPRPRG